MTKASVEELRPCPFCGMPARTCPDTGYGFATVFCPDENECPVAPTADAAFADDETLADAIERWNTRAPDPTIEALKARIGELEEALKPFARVPDSPNRPDGEMVKILRPIGIEELAERQEKSGALAGAVAASGILSVGGVALGDFRRARALLSPEKGEGE